MRSISRFVLTVIGALVAIALTVGFASTASAAPGEAPQPTAPVATAPIAAAAEPTPQADLIGQCLAPGDTIEVRTLVGGLLGATIGGIAGLPLFFVGAIPGLVIGGLLGVLIGSTSYAVDEGHMQQAGLC
ncbi:hypothetical protein [Nocardia vinacea]|uniref:hypothetical protein n=1 Tax=Nocardia vinacea TaxID=96468 RepID=UPI00031519A9|nr:hypothetical protein [Nocardia vinacea]